VSPKQMSIVSGALHEKYLSGVVIMLKGGASVSFMLFIDKNT